MASTELLPHLIYFTPDQFSEPQHLHPPRRAKVTVDASKGMHGTKKRLRESLNEEEETHEGNPPSPNSSFLRKYLTPPQSLIIEKLLRDAISLFAIDHTHPSDGNVSTNGFCSSKSINEKSLESLNEYFGSSEFLELVSDSLNLFLLHSLPADPKFPSQLLLPTHRTAIELCLHRSSKMKEILSQSNRHKICSPELSSSEYELCPVVWTSPMGDDSEIAISGHKSKKKILSSKLRI